MTGFRSLLVAVAAQLGRNVEPERCGNCRYFRADAVQLVTGADADARGTCRAELPKVLTYQAPAQLGAIMRGQQQQATAMNVQSFWAPVSVPEWCAQYRRRKDAAK